MSDYKKFLLYDNLESSDSEDSNYFHLLMTRNLHNQVIFLISKVVMIQNGRLKVSPSHKGIKLLNYYYNYD